MFDAKAEFNEYILKAREGKAIRSLYYFQSLYFSMMKICTEKVRNLKGFLILPLTVL